MTPTQVVRIGAGIAVAAVIGALSGGVTQADGQQASNVGPLWLQQQLLNGSDQHPGDQFGTYVAISGTTILASTPCRTISVATADGGTATFYQGAAYVFVQSGGSWTQQAEFLGYLSSSCDSFGDAVAVEGDVAFVSAGAGANGAGQVAIYTRAGSTWAQAGMLPTTTTNAAGFGAALAISGGTLAVGSNGPVSIYTGSGTTWAEQAEVLPSDPDAGAETFGGPVSLALSGSILAVGDYDKDASGIGFGGEVYVYAQSGTTWTQQAAIPDPGGVTGDLFGSGLAIVPTTGLGWPEVLVGMPGNTGTVGKVFEYLQGSSGQWTQQAQVLSEGIASDGFGAYLAFLNGNGLLVAVPGAVQGSLNSGAIYAYGGTGPSWSVRQKVFPSPQNNQQCGGACIGGDLAADGNLFVTQGVGGTSSSVPGPYTVFVFEYSHPLADSCTLGSDCISAFCAQGVCCDAACTGGACQSCNLPGSVGTCTTAPAGYAGNPPCGNGLACDGTDLTCPSLPCSSDADCLPSDYCSASGACVAQKAQAAACNESSDCKTTPCRECPGSNCVDGVCCDGPCNGLCEACAASLQQSTADGGAPQDGVCGFAKNQSNPHNDTCPVSAPSTCGTDGQCDGTGACALYYPSGTSCGPSACMSGNKAAGDVCNGSGACRTNPAGQLCDPYVCASGSCPTACAQDSQCVAGDYCKQGACIPLDKNGTPCAGGMHCASVICTDGVCCNSACSGECEACDAPGTPGTCTPIVGAPHGSRPACPAGDAGDVCAGAQCDGITATMCGGFVGSSQVCRKAACKDAHTAVPGASCDGKGDCPAATPVDCGAFLCDGATGQCKTSCASSTDCAPGGRCESGKCVSGATCDGDHTVTGASGQKTDCSPYECATNGTCLTACTSVDQCVAPDDCDTSSGQCIAPPSGGNTGGGGGGCATGGGGAGGGAGALGAMALAAAALRRRRRRGTGSQSDTTA